MEQIQLDPTIARKLEQGMRGQDSVELPFPTVYLWALNGQTAYKSNGGAMYYGGWACKAEEMVQVTDKQALSVPADMKLVTIASRDGGEFEAYVTRHVIVAPIGKREAWLFDGKRYKDYVEGGRRHLQVLCYMATSDQGEGKAPKFSPWGPVVLTAKGYQARNLLEAFAKWNKATAQLRWKVAPGVPAWCFYLAVGTFGKERQAINVGKPGAQSPITPISAHISDRLNEELISSLFVGNEIAALMSDIQDQARDWLEAWKNPGEHEEAAEPENGYLETENGYEVDSFPF